MNKDVYEIIRKLNQINDGAGGECANFAIALNRLLGNKGTYLALLDSVYTGDGLNHVVLKVGAQMYDSSGIISTDQILERYAYDEDYDDTKFWLEEVSEEHALNKTECGDLAIVENILHRYKTL